MRTRIGIAAVRGAISVPADTPRDIRAATARLLRALIEVNRLTPERIVSAVFTTTPDLESEYPAHAARELGWHDVPLLGAREIQPPGALPRVVRVLLTVRDPGASRLRPVYLDEAARLRPDLAGPRAATAPARATRRIALIGVGQIGGSLGLALAERGWWRMGYDLQRPVLRRAVATGAIDQACASIAAACAGADLAVVAVPMDAMPTTIDAAARALPKGAALIDTGSAKLSLEPSLARARRRGIHALGAHPIAGHHGRGFAAARGDLFRGTTFCLITGGRPIPAEVRELVRSIGARPRRVEPRAHDRALARTSHLPYLLACAVRDLGADAAGHGLSGGSFADFTRVAASDPAMAGAYCRANAAEIRAAWRSLRSAVDTRLRGLDRGVRTLARGRRAR